MPIYFCPALLDLNLFLVIFAVNYGAGARGMTMWECAWLGGAMQIGYMATSLLAGLLLSRRNARPVLIVSTVASAATAIACLVATHFWPVFLSMFALGVATALFFNAFQSFLRGEAPPGGLGRVIGIYTFAWSAGCSVGTLASGSLYRLGPIALGAFALLIGAVVLTTILRYRPRPHDAPSSEEHTEACPHGTPEGHTTYVWIGWMMMFTATLVQRPIQSFYPATCAGAGIAPFLVSLPLFLHLLVQSGCGFGLGRMRSLLYRSGPLFAIQATGGVLLLVLWLTHSWTLAAVGISVLGIWAGFAFFCAVYYSSNSGRRARNIGVNEFMVGFGSFFGLFGCAWAMRSGADPSVMYAVCGAAMLLSALAQTALAVLRKGMSNGKASQRQATALSPDLSQE